MLSLIDVSYNYEGTTKKVLKNITAEFEVGKLYAIVGKSGSGKTTMLSLMAGLDKVKEGEILYKGQNLSKVDLDKYRAESIGVVFQSYNLLTNATALENIILSMNISGVKCDDKKSKSLELLHSIGIDGETAERKILKLSGGEQQRVGIARALAHNPDIIIADEPTGNLDKETERDIMTILSDLAHKEKKCVILVTHSQKVASYADVVFKMSNGVIAI